VLAVAVVGVVGYAALLWQAAAIHEYWNLWGLVPVGLAVGLAVDQIPQRRVAVAVAALAVTVAPLGGADARGELAAGAELGAVVARVELPRDQPGWVLAGLPGSDTWVAYATDRPVLAAGSLDELRRLAARHPRWWALVPCRLAAADRCAAVGPSATVVLGVAAGQLRDLVPALAQRS